MAINGRPIDDRDEDVINTYDAIKSSGDSFWRRWWYGVVITLCPVLCFQFIIQFMISVGDTLNVKDSSNNVLRSGVAAMAMIFVVVFIPVATYEIAYRFAIRSWYKRHKMKSRRTEQPSPQEHSSDLA